MKLMELMTLLFLLVAFLVSLSSSTSISDGNNLSIEVHIVDNVFESHTSISGRNLLQTKKKCEVSFEFMNYTTLTRQCKGPTFPAKECCSAFKEFACHYVNEINDMTTDCAQTMFSYMNKYGNYPPGLFAHECREGKNGLVCPSPPLSSPKLKASTAGIPTAPRLLTLLISAAAAVLAFLVLT